MKASKINVASLASIVRDKVNPVEVSDTNLVAYYLDDITVLFSPKGNQDAFYGVVVDVLGRTFHIAANLKVLIEDDATTGDEDPAIYEIEEPSLIEFVNNFLSLRVHLLEKLGV